MRTAGIILVGFIVAMVVGVGVILGLCAWLFGGIFDGGLFGVVYGITDTELAIACFVSVIPMVAVVAGTFGVVEWAEYRSA